MKFTVGRDVLSEAVTWTARTVPNRPSVPILAGIRIVAEDGTLSLSSFDYETSTRSQIEADVEVPGDILVSGRMLASITKALPNSNIDCELEENKLNVVCGATHFALATMSVDEYPILPNMPKVRGTIDSAEFAKAVAQVSIAASPDETIPLLTGVRMEIEDDKITLLATDRYRLATRELSWNPAEAGISTELLVKARTLVDVSKSMTSSGKIELAFDADEETQPNSLIGFTAGTRRTTSTLMDGQYPPVKRLFPTDTTVHKVVNRHELLDAVKRVSLVVEGKTSLLLKFEGDQLVLEAGQTDNAQASDVIGVNADGGNIQTAFNPRYLESGLSAINEDFVRFAFVDPAKPAVLTGENERGEMKDAFRYLLMPIRFGL